MSSKFRLLHKEHKTGSSRRVDTKIFLAVMIQMPNLSSLTFYLKAITNTHFMHISDAKCSPCNLSENLA